MFITLFIYTLVKDKRNEPPQRMKKLLKSIEELTQAIENGFLTLEECNTKLKALRNSILDKYEEGTDNFIICLYPLIDADELKKELFNL